MKTLPSNLLLSLTFIVVQIGLTAPSLAETVPAEATCHMLMMEHECSQFETTMARLKPGPERDRYLAELDVLLREREAACSCNRRVMAETIYPMRRQKQQSN